MSNVRPPNIILCTCDQLRTFEVGCYGNEHIRTPNIDRLADEGTRFDLGITPNPLCTPARSAILAGQYSRTCTGMISNVHRNPPNPERVRLVDSTLPECLRDAGYHTELIGKWHIDPQPQLVGFNSAIYPMVAHRNFDQVYFDQNGEAERVSEFGPEWEFQRTDAFLRGRRDADEPFFLFYNISPPHQPIGPGHLPEKYTGMYDPQSVPLRPNTTVEGQTAHDPWWFSVYASADFFWRELRKDEQDPADIVPDDFDLRDLTALYYGATTFVDDQVGRLMATLSETGLDENTIVVFTSDHGDNLGSHGFFNKGSLIEEALRVPVIVRDPREDAHVNGDHVVSLIDVMPTLLELAGLEVPGHVQGESLAPVVRGTGLPSRENALFSETQGRIGIRTPTHLYAVKFDQEQHCVVDGDDWFYDLRSDPLELRNLAALGEQAETARELRSALLTWDRETPWHDLEKPEDDVAGFADQLHEDVGV